MTEKKRRIANKGSSECSEEATQENLTEGNRKKWGGKGRKERVKKEESGGKREIGRNGEERGGKKRVKMEGSGGKREIGRNGEERGGKKGLRRKKVGVKET